MKNTTLIILLLLLIGAVAAIQFLGGDKERSFRTEIVELDTAKVTSISLFPRANEGKEIKLTRQDSTWSVQQEDGSIETANQDAVNGLLGTLLTVKPKRLAAKSDAKWEQYEVTDSKGTRVKVREGDKEVLDLYIGKFSVKQNQGGNPQLGGQQLPPQFAGGGGQQPQPTLTSYVRVSGEQETYAVDGMLNFAFNRKPEDFIPAPPEPAVSDSTAAAVDSLGIE